MTSTLPPRQNCLVNGLLFVMENPDYELRYNSGHVIAVPKGTADIEGFLSMSAFGYSYFKSGFGTLVPDELQPLLMEICGEAQS